MGTHERENGSRYTGDLTEGCRLCGRGSKLVLLVSGRCSSGCFYCPLSDEKRGRDVTYANERPVDTIDEVVEEARLIEAEGTGVTGGDPAQSLDRTLGLVRGLRSEFGDDHHIHLYTSVPLDMKELKALREAGLDEIRFHPPPEDLMDVVNAGYADAVASASRLGMEAGYEVPVLPDLEEALRAFLDSIVDAEGSPFVNLNELEFSITNAEALKSRGYRVVDDISAAVAGSEELGRRMVEEFSSRGLRVHYCSASFKDGIQLRRRLDRRARNVAKPYEVVTDDQTILKGVVECEDPGAIARDLMARFDVPPDLLQVDEARGVLEIAAWVLEELEGEIEGDCYLVEEYPTWDRLEVERGPIGQLRIR